MNHPAHVQNYMDSELSPLFKVVDDLLGDWDYAKCYQLPVLMMNIKDQMKWEGKEGDKQFRAKDPIIRDYIRCHPVYYITRGAHGGVQLRDKLDKKEALVEAKRKAKEEISALIDANIAKKNAAATPALDEGEDTGSDADEIVTE